MKVTVVFYLPEIKCGCNKSQTASYKVYRMCSDPFGWRLGNLCFVFVTNKIFAIVWLAYRLTLNLEKKARGWFLKKLWCCVGGDVKHKILDLSTELMR